MKYLIVGLGNIGADYADTRHNIGFVVADALAQHGKATFSPGRYGDMAKIKHRARTLLILKPSTYMNLSGKAIKYWMTKENIPIEHVMVVVDDLALPLGTIRIKAKGGDGGHNGLSSIIQEIGQANFPRLRMGIGDDFAKGYQVDYVLGKWTAREVEQLIPRIKTSVEAILSFVSIGAQRTMNTFNTRPGETGKPETPAEKKP